MKKLSEVHPADAALPFEISLAKLVGRRIADVHGYVTDEFGQPNFKVTNIVFDDGTKVRVEGEHDFPYLSMDRRNTPPGLDEATLAALGAEKW